MVRETFVSDYRGVEFRDIKFILDGMNRSVKIAGLLSYEIEGVASGTENGEPIYIENVVHPVNSSLALARSSRTQIKGFGLNLDLNNQGNNGHFAPFTWTN